MKRNYHNLTERIKHHRSHQLAKVRRFARKEKEKQYTQALWCSDLMIPWAEESKKSKPQTIINLQRLASAIHQTKACRARQKRTRARTVQQEDQKQRRNRQELQQLRTELLQEAKNLSFNYKVSFPPGFKIFSWSRIQELKNVRLGSYLEKRKRTPK